MRGSGGGNQIQKTLAVQPFINQRFSKCGHMPANRDSCLSAPPTPPDMRVRIRRFEKLRSRGEPGNSQPVEVLLRQHDVDRVGRMVPPPLTANAHPPSE